MAKKDKFDRLLDLIQNGKTTAIRKAAATQIGFLQKEFSLDLSTILHKLFPLLLHHEFECRRATSTALENLIPNCRPERHNWKSNRPLLKLTQFNLQRIVSSKIFLTHNLTTHNAAASDYKDQVLTISPDSQIAELCEISERMIEKLNSENWHYRHGAVVCLLATITPACPREYLEDLAVRLLTLVAMDRFKDFSNDVVKVPVVDPACHLLARCLMMNIKDAVPILEQFHSFHSSDEDDDGWSLRFAFWNIVQHMLIIDNHSLDPEWLQNALLKTIKDNSDESQEEVIAAAIEAIIPIIPLFPNPGKVAESIYDDVFSMAEDLTSSNTACTNALAKFITDTQITSFLDNDTLDSLLEHAKYPQYSTREATYNLINIILDCHDHEIFDDFDFLDFAIKIIVLMINEPSNVLFRVALSMISCLNNLMESKGLYFNEEYCANVMEAMSAEFNKNNYKITLMIPIILKLASIVNIDLTGPKFTKCQTLNGVVFCIILCLNLDTSMPVFMVDNDEIFQKDPISILINLFSLDAKDVISLIPRISSLLTVFNKFVSTYIGRMLKNNHSSDVISQLIKMNADFEEKLLQNFSDTDNYASIITSTRRPPNINVAQTIAINAVYEVPTKLDSVYNILQLYYCIQAKMTLNKAQTQMIVTSMMKNTKKLSSMIAYVANIYAKTKPALLLSSFVTQIEEEKKLSLGPIEFIDLFLSDFDTTKLDLLSWASFFVKPCLKNFANQDDNLRRMAAHSLAQIVRLLPLDNGSTRLLPEDLHGMKAESMKYLAPLFDVTKSPEYKLMPPPDFSSINGGKIRSYQRDGINWLGFLYNYGLNGILADDMGLGKTFQCLCAISNAHTIEHDTSPFSLVVCPPSVISHWCKETNNFFPHLRVHSFVLKSDVVNSKMFQHMDGIIITSYGIIRSHIELFKSRTFTYCVLDEGHIIKNKSSKTAEAVTQLRADHRLILSGTPIQNNVAELWSLMDFLMPGYLGTQKVFQQKYESSIKKMFKPEASEAETEKGQQCLQLLHCQVLPFIMRRLRDVVLEELPPRIVYDEVFQMTDKQREVYNRLLGHGETLNDISDVDEHIFTKLKKERQLCIHPCLVDPSIPEEIEYSAKMKELRKVLLTQLGLGGGKDMMRNRALLFAQSSQTLDKVRDIVLSKIQGLTYDFFDGRVNEKDRPLVLERFNREDGPDLLLLTTSIGGLGLNLQVANNVIFMENSWNFTEDDQAMARAHRMGQRRTVTVFNLITSGTIESRIIEKQQMKRKMVKTIINEDNDQSQTDITLVQDSLYQDQETAKTENKKKLTQAEAIAESNNLIHDKEEYINEYRNDGQWISNRK
ncbi:SNF2 family N-terminal domain containing protein [Tritrichomonas foetus]|uniref:SNF2 family N-terminal domain containing protein n=1 Tax=Tritrichomonas foetus TaxID=1144522 RepID=A0A1J4KWN7_9EUKA|nr:SNF2 family N-terminal domain containing protein [Tritrichomonas foetus]|eukprot:OHT14118.1 SNF2 family N-terminal domain containing protein [Tritrichomonas foetus]